MAMLAIGSTLVARRKNCTSLQNKPTNISRVKPTGTIQIGPPTTSIPATPIPTKYLVTFFIKAEVENLIADAALRRPSSEDKPDLIINPHDLPSTARELAALIAHGTEFLFNGNAPVRV